jgi:hypothetical protein
MSLIDGEYVPPTEKNEKAKAPLRFSAQQCNVNIYSHPTLPFSGFITNVSLRLSHTGDHDVKRKQSVQLPQTGFKPTALDKHLHKGAQAGGQCGRRGREQINSLERDRGEGSLRGVTSAYKIGALLFREATS